MTNDASLLPPETLVEGVNAAFDRVRSRLGLSNDRDLAEHFGVSQKTISFWRNGRWTGADRVLISVLIDPSRHLDAA